MKIALCISGQPRDIEHGVNSFKENIIKPNSDHDIDVFCQYWFDENLVGQPFDSAQAILDSKVGCWSEKTHNIIETLSPKDTICEFPKKFEQFSHLTWTSEANQQRLASLFYAMWMCNEVKKYYEQKENFVYDIVIRARYDLHFFKPVILSDYLHIKDEYIIHDSKFQSIRMDLFNGGYTMNDLFALSSSSNMDIFCSVFPNFEKLYYEIIQAGGKPYGENYLGHHVRVNNKVNIAHTPDIEYTLVRLVSAV